MTPSIVDAFLRLPRVERARATGATLSAEGRSLAKAAYRVQTKGTSIEKPREGEYKTCTPASHSKQADRNKTELRLQRYVGQSLEHVLHSKTI